MEKICVLDNEEKLLELLMALGYQVVAYETTEGGYIFGEEKITYLEKPNKTDKIGSVVVNSIIINQETRTVMCKNKPVELTFKEYELLVYLVNNRTRVVSREELLNEIWGSGYNKKSRTLDIHIRTLRQKLGTDEGNSIKTYHNFGFRFIMK